MPLREIAAAPIKMSPIANRPIEPNAKAQARLIAIEIRKKIT